MASNMKTTVDIPDALLREAKAVAARESTTLKALIAEGLRWALGRRNRVQPFRLRRGAFRGRGVQKGIREGDWAQIRELLYGNEEA